MSSKESIATMLPKRKLLKSLEFLTKPERTPARPMPTDSVIATASSEKAGMRLRIASIQSAATTQMPTAPRTGLKPRRRPIATPASEECDSAEPIRERRLWTTTVPRHAMITERRMPTTKAFCMKG